MYFKHIFRSSVVLASCVLPGFAFAVTAIPITVTGGISFENPALLNQVQNTEIQIGTTFIPSDVMHYDGTVTGVTPETTVSGDGTSRISRWLPYFRIAQRVNDKLVVSLDVTEPLLGAADWNPDSITRTRTNYLNLDSYETAPRFSYQLTSHFAVGGSARVTHITQDLDFGFPPEPEFGGGAYATQHSEGYGYGWSAAGSYTFSEANILSLAYFSRINIDTEGFSAANTYNSHDYRTTVTEPGEWDLDYFHAFNQQWMATVKVIYAQWDVVKNIKLDNVAGAGDLTFAADLNNSWGVQVSGIYAYNEKLALFLGGGYNSQVVPEENEDPGYPNYPLYSVAIGSRYQASEHIAIQPSVGYGWSSGDIHNSLDDHGSYDEKAVFLGIGLIVTV